MSALEDFAEGAYSPILYLQNELLTNTNTSDNINFASSHFGVARGLVDLLRTSFSTEFEQVYYAYAVLLYYSQFGYRGGIFSLLK